MEWRKLKLGNPIFQINTRSVRFGELPEKFTYIDIDAVKNGRVINPKTISKAKAPSRARRVIKDGDVLIASVRPYLRSFAIVTNEYSGCIASTGFFVIEKNDIIEPRYLLHFALSNDFIQQTNQLTQGAQYPALNRELLNRIDIPIPFKNNKPDRAAQKSIIYKLDSILSLKEKFVSEIHKTETLFSSISKKEFEDARNSKNLKKLGEACDVVKGQFPILKTPEGKYPFVVTAEKRKSANDYQFDDEAVCIPLVSSTGHGKASLHRIHYENGKFALANIMVAIIPKDKREILAKYLYFYLSFYRSELFIPLMRGVANVTIPMRKIGEVSIPIPKIEIQKRIVSALDGVEKLKSRLIKQRELAETLLQSTMNYSFRM